jgi:hypothetical protein
MRAPSEAELIEMETRLDSALRYCHQIYVKAPNGRKTVDEDDLMDILDGLSDIEADFSALVEIIRRGKLAPDAR